MKNLETPTRWWYTWEAQSHSPTLRLCLSRCDLNPLIRCNDLRCCLNTSQSQLLVTWVDEEEKEVSLRVPVPRVLVDSECPAKIRALDDYIEVKLTLLLPVDHPIVATFDSVLNLSDDGGNQALCTASPLVLGSDLERLSSLEGVNFYCRKCSSRLTRSPLRNILEAPSINWREVADNWFGTCCCSFGGASEKLVARYANSYACVMGLCLLTATSVVLCKDDLEDGRFPKLNGISGRLSESNLGLHAASSEIKIDSERIQDKCSNSCNQGERPCRLDCDEVKNANEVCCTEDMPDEALVQRCCVHNGQGVSDISGLDIASMDPIKLTSYKKSLLNGFLEDVFMARASNLSRSVKWIEFVCPRCSSLLGAYPSCGDGDAPIDGGIRLFKCYISTSSAADSGSSSDIFRKYNMETMFANQLVESAKDELSFRILVRDLTTKRPMIQVVLLNPNSWQSTGCCLSEDIFHEPASRADMWPVAKVMFSDYSNATESQLREVRGKPKWYFDDEIFIFRSQAEELIRSLVSAHELIPSSCAYLQGFPVSSMRR